MRKKQQLWLFQFIKLQKERQIIITRVAGVTQTVRKTTLLDRMIIVNFIFKKW